MPFRVTITNDGDDPVTITSATDEWLGQAPKEPVRIDIVDAKGETVATFTGRPGETAAPAQGGGRGGGRGGFATSAVSTRQGLNRFMWNGRYPALFQIPQGIVMWGGGGPGPRGRAVAGGRGGHHHPAASAAKTAGRFAPLQAGQFAVGN